MQDYRIVSHGSLMTTLITYVSSLQGQLSATLGQIQALQARDQTHPDDREGAASTAVGLIFSFLVSDNHNNMPPRRSSATARAAATAAARAAAAATPMTAAAVEQLIEARVSAALANHETLRNSTNGQGDGSHNSDTRIRGTVRTLRKCIYKDFINCKPLTFKGTEGVVVLSQWFEKMESVFHISNCAVENQVKFATCTFLGNALTWWNSHMKTVTQDVAYAMDWKALKKMMTVKYCPRGEIKKLEIELWNLKVKGTDVASYTLRFQELALMCGRMFHEESEEVEKYVGGLPDMIRGNVMSYQPKTMEKAIEGTNNKTRDRTLAAAAAAAPMTAAAVEQLIEARVSTALANHETLRNSTNGHGDRSYNSDTGIRGTVRTPRECTYKDFLNCKPLTFKGTKGVVVLSQWFEKIESVFHISNCAMENQVKFATCTFLGNALTWWNSHMKTVTQDVAYAMDWKALKKMMTVKYCPRGEIKKLEIEL
ncbi:reverse transcriptase domain-containing protein [Tanacetum coccineum]